MDQLFAVGNVPDAKENFEITVCEEYAEQRAICGFTAGAVGQRHEGADDDAGPNLHAGLPDIMQVLTGGTITGLALRTISGVAYQAPRNGQDSRICTDMPFSRGQKSF
jgi:hypothetical protein